GTVGLITYMRTDSTRISETEKTAANENDEEKKGKKKVVGEVKKTKKKSNTQDAYEAIRPTSVMRTPESLKEVLSREQLRLYRLIWERFVASQMAPAILDTVTVQLKNGDCVFRANGSHVKFSGFMKVYIEGTDD